MHKSHHCPLCGSMLSRADINTDDDTCYHASLACVNGDCAYWIVGDTFPEIDRENIHLCHEAYESLGQLADKLYALRK